MNRDDILEFAKDVWGRDKLNEGRDNHLDFYVELVRAAMAKEREACVNIIEAYQIPVGNSAAGEMACEWTYDALHEIRDTIRARGEK